MPPVITSPANPRIKQVRSIQAERKDRRESGLFFAEGVHALNAALRNGWRLHTLIYCPDAIRSQWARELIGRTDPTLHLPISETLQNQLSDRETASEIMALIQQRPDDLARIPLARHLLVLLLDRPRNPGNLGSAIRSVDALGAHGVIITGHAVDLYDPKTVRASMGSLFEVPVVRVNEHAMLEEWLAAARARLGRVQFISTSAHAEQTLADADLLLPSVIAIGSEESGVSNYFEGLADVFVSIPMWGLATSLNASVAASICLYEASRQRVAAGIRPKPRN
jgi:23S rRNA (uridine2479-2'-O)-methyltransferase